MNCDPCKLLLCDEIDDFAIYNLQDAAAEFPQDDPSGTYPCAECVSFECENVFEDLIIYSLQTNIVFNTEPITVTVPCPPGWNCDNPLVVVYDPGTFVLPDPEDGNYTAQSCSGLITANSAEELFQLLAQAQALCDAIDDPPEGWDPPIVNPPSAPERTWYNETVTTSVTCTFPEELVLTGTPPSWISVDTNTGIATGSASVFSSEVSQADANSRAQTALQDWVNSALADGTLDCREPYENEEQSVSCPAGQADYYHDYNFSETQLYAIDGVVYARAGQFTSSISQADANAQALAAAQARFDLASSLGLIKCCTELSLSSIVTESIPSGCSVSKTFESYNSIVVIDWNQSCSCTAFKYYVQLPSQVISLNYSVLLPECAKGKQIAFTVEMEGQAACYGIASSLSGGGYTDVRRSITIASASDSVLTENSPTCPSGTTTRNLSATDSGIDYIPDTAGSKTFNLVIYMSYLGQGQTTHRVSVEILPTSTSSGSSVPATFDKGNENILVNVASTDGMQIGDVVAIESASGAGYGYFSVASKTDTSLTMTYLDIPQNTNGSGVTNGKRVYVSGMP